MSETRDQLRSRCERARGRGQTSTHFDIGDVESLLSECDRLERDNLDLLGRFEEARNVLR